MTQRKNILKEGCSWNFLKRQIAVYYNFLMNREKWEKQKEKSKKAIEDKSNGKNELRKGEHKKKVKKQSYRGKLRMKKDIQYNIPNCWCKSYNQMV